MKRHNNFTRHHGFREARSLTERQFRTFALGLQEDIMTKRQMVYAKFEAFEERLAHFYFLLHERFIANPELAKFWAEAAMDELQHNSLLRFCRERSLMSDVDVNFKSADEIENLLDVVKGIVSDPDVSIDEAFYASLLMESSELDEIYDKLTRGLAKDHRLLYDAIQSSLRSHHATFAEAAERFCSDRSFAEAFKNFGRMVV